MTESSCKSDLKTKNGPGMKLTLVRVLSCKHPKEELTSNFS